MTHLLDAHTPESVFAADSQKRNMVLLKLNRGGFVSFISIVQRWLWVTEIKDFLFSLAVSYDTELYNKDVNTNLLDNYSEMIEFCPSYRVVEKRHSQRGSWFQAR